MVIVVFQQLVIRLIPPVPYLDSFASMFTLTFREAFVYVHNTDSKLASFSLNRFQARGNYQKWP